MTDLPASATPCCGTCVFRLVNPDNINAVKCRRYPPASHLVVRVDGSPKNDISYFPLVERYWWCGEFVVDRGATT